MKLASALLVFLLVGCAGHAPETAAQWQAHFERTQKRGYREGVQAARADLRRGVLAFEDIQCEEEAGWRVLWCYRKLLTEKYGVAHRVISPSPIPGYVGRMEGYQSVVPFWMRGSGPVGSGASWRRLASMTGSTVPNSSRSTTRTGRLAAGSRTPNHGAAANVGRRATPVPFALRSPPPAVAELGSR